MYGRTANYENYGTRAENESHDSSCPLPIDHCRDSRFCFRVLHFPLQILGRGQIGIPITNTSTEQCCGSCSAESTCVAWTWHAENLTCVLKDNAVPDNPPSPIDPTNRTMSGLTSAAPVCTPTTLCPEGYPCPDCGATNCSCANPTVNNGSAFACLPPHDTFSFCDLSLSVHDRVWDLIRRINDSDKANLLTARGRGGDGQAMQALPSLGVPAYYWGTNCLHSLNGGDGISSCVKDSQNRTRCPTNFPSGPSFGAMFDRDLIADMANVVGQELRAMVILRANFQNSLD